MFKPVAEHHSPSPASTAPSEPATEALYEGPIADETSYKKDYGERNPDPPDDLHPLAWAVFQAFDPAHHTVEDRWRVAVALRDAPASCETPRRRGEVIARARVALDAAAGLRRAGDLPEGPAYVLAILGLPADYYARLDDEFAEFSAKPRKPCSCGLGTPGHIPLLREVEGSLAELKERLAEEPEMPPQPSYIQIMNDPALTPVERALARAVVERPARFKDGHFDMAHMATLTVLPPPDLAEGEVMAFALAWIEAARRTPRDAMGNSWRETITLAGRVARGEHPTAREFAWRLVQHIFSTHYTYAFSAEGLRDGLFPSLSDAPDWPELLAAAKAKRPDVSQSDWDRAAKAPVQCVGAPTVDDVVDVVDGYARAADRRTWQENLARGVRTWARMPALPRKVPGRCENFHHQTVDGQRVAVLCPNPATVTETREHSGPRHLCADCLEFERLLIERSDREMAQWQAAVNARREGLPSATPMTGEPDEDVEDDAGA